MCLTMYLVTPNRNRQTLHLGQEDASTPPMGSHHTLESWLLPKDSGYHSPFQLSPFPYKSNPFPIKATPCSLDLPVVYHSLRSLICDFSSYS